MRVSPVALSSALLLDLQDEIDVTLPGWAPDSSPREVACYLLRQSLLKKFNAADSPSDSACNAALDKFLAVNNRCSGWVIPYEFTSDEEIVQGVKDALYNFWYVDGETPIVHDFGQIYRRGRAGPGSSVGARDCDLYTKMYDSPLTGTGDLPFIWDRCVSLNATSAEAELTRQQWHGTQRVEHSNYSFVNKTTTVARGICTEPSINMWFQLGFGAILEDRLYSVFGIDFRVQPDVNRAMARQGSIDGCVATIDLESASDSMGLGVLEEICPRDMFAWLKILRTPMTKLPNQERVKLNMVSTMGNGFTFPLQTLLFCCVVKSVYSRLGIGLKNRGLAATRNFAVFGDDIIVDTRAVRTVVRALNLLGFQVNTDKTFVEGRFRESCGADYIDGVNVRGVYIKSTNTQQDLVAAINVLNRWTTRTGVSLRNVVRVLLNGLPPNFRNFVPPDEGDASGIHIPLSLRPPVKHTGKARMGQRDYYAWFPVNWEFIIVGGHCWTYQEQVRRNYNPAGLLIAFLAGGIRGYRVSLRQRKIRYTTKRRMTPRWDHLPPRPLEDPDESTRSRRFVDACTLNLVGWGALERGE